jgi:membrane protein implicated in regulation of membrane protease activity
VTVNWLIIFVGALVIFVGCMVAGRYTSWFGIGGLAAVILLLGYGWEWDPEAMPFVVAAGLVGALGLATGIHRRRKMRRAAQPSTTTS